MKLDPISTHERCSITHQIADSGTWEATRKGHAVRLYKIREGDHFAIQWGVEIGRHKSLHGKSSTVSEAIDEVNAIIKRLNLRSDSLQNSDQKGLFGMEGRV